MTPPTAEELRWVAAHYRDEYEYSEEHSRIFSYSQKLREKYAISARKSELAVQALERWAEELEANK